MTVGDFIRTLQELIDRGVILDRTPISGATVFLVRRVWSSHQLAAIREELAGPMVATPPDEDLIAREVAAEMDKL